MSTRANVQSTEAIESVRTALVKFVDQVADALAALDLEMRRVMEWLEHDRPKHWRTQTRVAVDQVHEAQAALHRCLMYPIGDERPSCTEERAALKRAKARLAYCETKEQRVRHWMHSVRHELFEYEGRISQLVRLVEIEAPEAIGVLNKILRRLEEYHSIRVGPGTSAFGDMALAAELWPGEPASAGGESDAKTKQKTPPAEAGAPKSEADSPAEEMEQ